MTGVGLWEVSVIVLYIEVSVIVLYILDYKFDLWWEVWVSLIGDARWQPQASPSDTLPSHNNKSNL